MNFFKQLFKVNGSKEILNSPANIDITNNYNVEEKAFHEIDKPKEENIEQPKLTEEEKNILIEKLARDQIWGISIEQQFLSSCGEPDPLLEDAARLIVENQVGSTALIQRRMKLGYNRVGRLMDQLEMIGIVGANQGAKAREVLIKTEADLEQVINNEFNFQKSGIDIFYDEHRIEIEKKKLAFIEEEKQQKIEYEKNLIKQQLLEKERKKKLQLEAYKELIDQGSISNQSRSKDWSREPIPQEIMDKVWNRDSGRCVKCGSQENLEFDHIIPFSKGGANTYRNLQILCKKCNIEKSDKIG